jgi:hypothetical protein
MPRKTTTPGYYRTPLRSRSDIADYLAKVGGYYSTYGRQGHSYFSFNVKCSSANLDFEHLIEVYRDAGYYGDGETWLDNPEWLVQAQAKYEEAERHLFDRGVEDASRMVTDSDCYTHLYDGTKVEVEYAWMGRSSGYIGIGEFEGFDLSKDEGRDFWHEVFRGNPHRGCTAEWLDWERTFPAMSYPTLRKLYALVVMLSHDLTPEKASAEVEHHVAFQFIENLCSDIPRYDSIQRLLPLAG